MHYRARCANRPTTLNELRERYQSRQYQNAIEYRKDAERRRVDPDGWATEVRQRPLSEHDPDYPTPPHWWPFTHPRGDIEVWSPERQRRAPREPDPTPESGQESKSA